MEKILCKIERSRQPNVIPNGRKPLVTLALFAYNQELFIREAVQGAFAQTYNHLEIILSDDCSTDGTFEIMNELAESYVGIHAVRVRRSEVNLGLLSHVLSVAREASGSIFVVAAGDDISLAERVEITVDYFANTGHTAISGDDIIIDQESNVACRDVARFNQRDKWHDKSLNWVHGATAAYRTAMLNDLPFPRDYICFEDVVLPDVSALIGLTTQRLRIPLIWYRYHENNISNRFEEPVFTLESETKAIQLWERMRQAKLYCLSLGVDRVVMGRPLKPAVRARIYREYRYFDLISNWKSLAFSPKLKLLYYGVRTGNISTVLIRVFGPSFFIYLKLLKQKISKSYA